MNVSLMARLKELEEENRRLKEMRAEERLKVEVISEASKKVVKPFQECEMVMNAVTLRPYVSAKRVHFF